MGTWDSHVGGAPAGLESAFDAPASPWTKHDWLAVLGMQDQNLSLALTGQASVVFCGTVRPDWRLTSASGETVPASTVALVGEACTSELGTLIAEIEQTDRTEALAGEPSLTALGTLAGAADSPLLGASVSLESGTLTTSSSSVVLGLTGEASSGATGTLTAEGSAAADDGADLFALQRQRRFGRDHRPMVQSRYPRKVR